MENEKIRVQKYWDTHVNTTQLIGRDASASDADLFGPGHKIRREKFPYILDLIDNLNVRDRDVLEVGCGMGCDLVEIARRGARATGIDLTPAGIALARRNLAWSDASARILVADAENLPFPDASFDIVYSMGVLHHTPDTDRAIREVFRVLRPGGTALIMLYNRNSWFTWLSKATGTNVEFAEEDAPIVKFYSVADIQRMFKDFEDVSIDFDCFPTPTVRGGVLSSLYNALFVPGFKLIPRGLTRQLGFHLVIQARRPKN